MKDKTLITLLVDRSQSMKKHLDTTVSGLNEFVGSLRGGVGDARISLVGFTSMSKINGMGFSQSLVLNKALVAEPLNTMRELTRDDLGCEGGTPLLAAIWTTIHAVRESLVGRTDVSPIVVIQTDGEENTSHLIQVTDGEGALKAGVSHADVRALISLCKEEGWEFVFLGCGIDAYRDGINIGLSGANVVSYGAEEDTTKAVFRATAKNASSYLSGLSATMAYSDNQKAASGDAFQKRGR